MPHRRAFHFQTARHMLGEASLLSFLRWTRGQGVATCEQINNRLEAGESLEQIFANADAHGFYLEAERIGKHEFMLKTGFQALDGPCGTRWRATFSASGEIESATSMDN